MKQWQRIFMLGLICTCCAALALGATPKLVNYQARLTEPDGEPISDTVDMVFTVYDAEAGGTVLWQETHSNVAIVDGLFEVILGAGTPAVELSSEVFAASETWLGVQIGSDPEMSPRTRLVAVPYSQRVNTIDQAEGGQVLGPVVVNPNPNKDFDAAAGKLVVKGSANDSVTIDPGGDVVISGTNDAGDEVALITAGDDGGLFQVTASDAAKATSRTVQIDPANGVLLKGTEQNGDDVVLITAGENGGALQVTASDAAKATSRTVQIDPAQGVVLKSTEQNGDDAVLITANGDGGFFQVTASDAAKSTSRSLTIDPANGVLLKGTEQGGDDVVLITAGEAGGTIVVTASDAAKANPNTVTGTVIINKDGIFILSDSTSDTTLAITSEGDIVGNGEIAMGENSDNAGTGSSVLGLNNNASGNYSTVTGGQFNDVEADYAAILGGFADTIFAGADYSYLFGIGSTLYADSTFLVDMPHIRFGDEATGYEFPTMDGSGGQVLVTDGAGQLSWMNADLGGDDVWYRNGSDVALSNLGDQVGIGMTDPSEKLDVDGNIKSSGSLFVGDALNFDGESPTINSPEQLTVNAPEGIHLNFEEPEAASAVPVLTTSTGAYLSENGNWVNAGCGDFASTFAGVNSQELLDKVATLPIKQWTSESQSGQIKHIAPSAQDFYAKFGLGSDSTTVSTVDPAGVALAAIQALYQKTVALEQQTQQIVQMQKELNDLKAQMQKLATAQQN